LSKRALLLTAATAALLSGPALAQETISNKVTVPQYTDTEGTITITSTGSIVLTANPPTTPVVTLNGGTTAGAAADVLNLGTISYTGQGSPTNLLTGVELIGTNVDTPTGGFDNAAKMDFSGAGSNKTGILVAASATSFIGDIGCTQGGVLSGGVCSVGTPISQLTGVQDTNLAAILLEAGSSLKIQGDASFGIDIAQGATLGDVCANCASDIDIAGNLTMTPPSASSTSSVASGVYIAGTLNGDLNLIDGGSIDVEGTESFGINVVAPDTGTGAPGGVVNGNIVIDGSIIVAPISSAATASGGNIAMYLGGTVNGNVDIYTSGEVTASGNGAEGVVIAGPINGAFENQNLLDTFGVATPSTNGGNAQAGSALIVNANVSGGIFNAGPVSNNDTTDTTASITTGGDAPTIVIAPTSTSTAAITIGTFTSQGDSASLLNRGTISNGSANADPTFAPASIEIEGISPTFSVNLPGGIFNSGSITSTLFTDSKGSSLDQTIDIIIGDYATIGGNGITGLTNSNEVSDKPGNISATASGDEGGQATAIDIQAFGNLASILNEGTITASAGTSNKDLINGALKATAILDSSGTLTSITNDSGALIGAFATLLKDDSQVTIAVDVSANTTGVTFLNNGTVNGDIRFGSGNDMLQVAGSGSTTAATVTGNIYFGGNNATTGGGADTLLIQQYGTVTGQVYSGTISTTPATEEEGLVNVEVDDNGTLNLLTAASDTSSTVVQQNQVEGAYLNAGNFVLESGSTTDIHYSQAYMQQLFQDAARIKALTATINDGATVLFTPDSFIAPPIGDTSATFAILETPAGVPLNISAFELDTINTAFTTNLSYLYNPDASNLTVNNGNELLLTITPKTIGADGCKTPTSQNCNMAHIPLSGYAAQLFPYVNVALGTDNALGSAVIQSVKNSYDAENTYTAFAPDVSGATRALAISLTDDATSLVAARQKELREYANQDGDLTLWGQQIVQRLNQSGTDAGPGYRDTGFGFALGADEGDPVDGRYGGAFTFFSGDARATAPATTKTTSEWYLLTGYTDWRGKGLFLDTNASVGYVSLTGNRYLDLQVPNGNGFTAFNRDAQEHHPGEMLSGGVTSGAVFDEDGTVFTPQISLDGLTMREEQYNESGGDDGMDLHVSSASESSLRGFAGLNVRQDFDFTDFLLQPDITAGYRYDFANGAQSLKANFEAVNPPSVFSLTGPKPDAGNAVVQGGVAVSTGAWSLGLSFDYLKAGSGNTAEQGTITLLGRI
jgi:hypothetical protein